MAKRQPVLELPQAAWDMFIVPYIRTELIDLHGYPCSSSYMQSHVESRSRLKMKAGHVDAMMLRLKERGLVEKTNSGWIMSEAGRQTDAMRWTNDKLEFQRVRRANTRGRRRKSQQTEEMF